MICVSLAEPSLPAFLKALKGLPMAEIRMDAAPLSREEIVTLFRQPLPLVATFRRGRVSEAERLEALRLAVASGASFVDLEADVRPKARRALVREAKERGCRVILSSHSGRRPPSVERLARERAHRFRSGADIVKIVHRVTTSADCARLLSLYDTPRAGTVVAVGLGRLGAITRIAAPFLGAPFTYASLRPGRETAEGQIDWKTLDRILSGLRHA